MKAKAFFFHKPHSFYLKATVFLLLSDIVIQILIFHFIEEASLVSDASKKLFKTLTPLALFVASQCSVAHAAGTVQIVGPDGKDQTLNSQVVVQSQSERASTNTVVREVKATNAATKMYGPTREDETLWSIASRVNPSNTTSVQQTLLAIYRLNPQAFENNNIHGLEPNSRLRLPTLEQVRRENTDDAKQLLIAHKNKQNAQKTVSTTAKTPVVAEKKTVPAPKERALAPNKEEASIANKSPIKEASKTVAPASVIELKSELDTTEQEFSALQENNHQLRIRLAEVQNEVDSLKDSLGDEDRIRNEVEKFINEQKQLAATEKKAEPSAMDNLASSPGLIALLALIPGALIAGLIAFFLFRRKKEEDSEAESTPEVQPSALIMPEDNFNMDDDIPEISLDDDDDILGELNDDKFLFGDDDSDSSDDLFAEFETENNSSDNDDPFASLEGEDNDDLDLMLSDDELDLDLDLDGLDDDIDMSSSALTVDAEEKALGLEEMEKALNDFDSDLFSASDLEEEDDDFDLSLIDDSDLSALDKSTPELDGNEDLEGGELDQSMLDDLFSSMDMEDDSEESELDQGWALDEKEETKLAPEPVSNSIEDELDFDTLLSGMEESNKEESIELDDDALFGGLDEESTSLEVESDSTALLDELLDESDNEDDIDLDIEDDSTALLDELLDESDDDSIDLDIEDDSTALLDELLGDDELSDDDDDIEIDEDSTALLDEFLADEDEEETIDLGEDSTVLLDELLGDDVEEEETTPGKSGDDTDVEGVAVSEVLSEDTPRDEDWLVEADEDEDDDISLFESDTEQKDTSLELDDLLEPEAELESEQADDLPEQEESVELETPATEQAQELEPELEAETEAELNDLFTETEALDIESDESLVEEDELSFDLDDLLEPEAELESEQADDLPEQEESVELEAPATEQAQELEPELEAETEAELNDLLVEEEELGTDSDESLVEDDENDFSLDDFLENSAVDFSQPNSEIQLDDTDTDTDTDSSFEGLSIEDALAALEDESDTNDITEESEVTNTLNDGTSLDDEVEPDLFTEDTSKLESLDFHSRVSDEEKEALTHLDSSGLDIDNMLDDEGSDWSGFTLNNNADSDDKLEDEDWSEQPNIENDPHGEDRFLSIEALIAETENGDKSEFEEEDLNLDVGLDDFPDMLGNVGSHDVDVNSDAQSKLDLAKAYIEMSDDKGALELLEEVLKCDDPSLKVEAEKLMRQID